MKRNTRQIFGKVSLSFFLLTATLFIHLGVDGQATTYHTKDVTTQKVPFAVTLTASFVPPSKLSINHKKLPRVSVQHGIESLKKYKRLESIKDKKQLGLTLFFLGMVGEKV